MGPAITSGPLGMKVGVLHDLVSILSGYLPPSKILILMCVDKGFRKSVPACWKHPVLTLSFQGAKELTLHFLMLFKGALTIAIECTKEPCTLNSIWFDVLIQAQLQDLKIVRLKIRAREVTDLDFVATHLKPVQHLCVVLSGKANMLKSLDLLKGCAQRLEVQVVPASFVKWSNDMMESIHAAPTFAELTVLNLRCYFICLPFSCHLIHSRTETGDSGFSPQASGCCAAYNRSCFLTFRKSQSSPC